MINVIKMNIYRFFHTKSLLLVMLIFCVILPVGMSFLAYKINEYSAKEAAAAEAVKDNSDADYSESQKSNGITVEVEEERENLDDTTYLFNEFVGSLTNGVIALFLTIILTIFAHGERKNGFIKNIAGQCRYKSYNYIGKAAVVAVVTIVTIAVFGVFLMASEKLFFGDTTKLIDTSDSYICIKLLLGIFINMAFAGLFVMLTVMLRGFTIPMIAGILCTLGIESFIPNLDAVLHTNIYDYLLMTNLGKIGAIAANSDAYKILAVGIGFIIVYNIIAVFIENKRDVV